MLFAQQKFEVALWPDGPPFSKGLWRPESGGKTVRLTNVSNPSFTAYLSEESNGAAILASLGGGYGS